MAGRSPQALSAAHSILMESIMRKLFSALVLVAASSVACAAGQYDGIWSEGDGTAYAVYSTIYTASNGMLYKIDVEPTGGRTLAGSWIGTTLGMLIGNRAVVSGETDNCSATLTITFTSATAATMQVTSATALPGRVCDMPQGDSTTLHKLL
jgi:hypothetical protein